MNTARTSPSLDVAVVGSVAPGPAPGRGDPPAVVEAGQEDGVGVETRPCRRGRRPARLAGALPPGGALQSSRGAARRGLLQLPRSVRRQEGTGSVGIGAGRGSEAPGHGTGVSGLPVALRRAAGECPVTATLTQTTVATRAREPSDTCTSHPLPTRRTSERPAEGADGARKAARSASVPHVVKVRAVPSPVVVVVTGGPGTQTAPHWPPHTRVRPGGTPQTCGDSARQEGAQT